MKKTFVAIFLLLLGTGGCGSNFEWFPEFENISSISSFSGYSAVFVSSAITDSPGTSTPQALAVLNGTVFAVDKVNNRILKYDSSNGRYSGKFGTGGTDAGEFSNPTGIASDGTNLHIVDFPNVPLGNGRVQTVTPAGNFVTTFGNVIGSIDLNKVFGIASVKSSSNSVLFLTENDTGKILKIDITTPGNPILADEWGSNGTASGQFSTPHAVAVASLSGPVFISDTGNNRIQRLSLASGTFSTFPTNVSGSAVNSPEGLAIFGSDLFVADNANHRVAVFDATTMAFKTAFGSQGDSKGKFIGPLGVAVDTAGAVFVSDSTGRVQKFVKK